MIMDSQNEFQTGTNAFGRWIEKLNHKLFPLLGPPPLGPYDEEPVAKPAVQLCPLCGHRMDEHEIDRSGERTQLYCPTETAA
jgi:hypothetical protein